MQSTKANRNGEGIVLTERDRRVLEDVANLSVTTRMQLQRLGHFASKTRANERLGKLAQFDYLVVRHAKAISAQSKAIYSLGSNGLRLSDVAPTRRNIQGLSDLFVEHQLQVNDVRIGFQASRPGYLLNGWETDEQLRDRKLSIVPDGYVDYSINDKLFSAFLEVDRGTETLSRWDRKVADYVRFAMQKGFEASFGRKFFRVLVVADSGRRLANLRATTHNRTDRIFWFISSAALSAHHPIDCAWLRPDGSSQSLSEGKLI